MTEISVAVIAKNSASTLSRCLRSCREISSDLVVVVDSASADSTAAIAESNFARVYHRPFDNFAQQKNFAVSRCRHDWVLSLDADEYLSSELITQLQNWKKSPPADYQAFLIPRQNYIFSKLILHSNWSPGDDTHIWFFDKRRSAWQGIVHELVVVSGSVGRFTGPKIHLNYQTIEEFLRKMNQYTTLEADRRTFSWIMLFIYPLWKFLRHFVVFRGFMDGSHGFVLAYLQALYGLQVYIKLWQKKHLS